MENVQQIIKKIKNTKPLVLNLTNFVTMDFVANGLLAIGAAPIVCLCEDEIEELVKLSAVIYINIGTLNDNFIQLIKAAIIFAKKYNKPIVFDPVGCGATNIRTKLAIDIAPNCEIIRGNASEIMALGSVAFGTKGVESIHKTQDAAIVATKIAQDTAATIIISGAMDYITDGGNFKKSSFGSAMMANITGMGCALTAIVAACLAVTNNAFLASVLGVEYFTLCGELVGQKNQQPGCFKSAFIDMLYSPDFDVMQKIILENNNEI